MKITQLSPNIGANIDGVDLSKPLTPEVIGTIKAAWDQHLVLRLRNQSIDLCNAIEAAHGLGLQIVLGDGLGSDINCFLEALVSERYLHRAGEFNGCFKIRDESRILAPHLKFEDGHMILEKSARLNLNKPVINARTVRKAMYGETDN